MRHVRKTPSLCNLGYGSMDLVGLFKGKPATRESSGQNERVKRGILFGKKRIGVSDAYSKDIGDLLSVERGISEPCALLPPLNESVLAITLLHSRRER
jgi:hypothetical protein